MPLVRCNIYVDGEWEGIISHFIIQTNLISKLLKFCVDVFDNSAAVRQTQQSFLNQNNWKFALQKTLVTYPVMDVINKL